MKKSTGRRSTAGMLFPREARSVQITACLMTLAIATVASLAPTPALAQHPLASTDSLKRLSIEELMSLEVTSVSRAPQSLSSAPAAVTVVTNDDIRRSGATTIPGALRMVPGVHVARRNSNSWAVSSRGFSSVNSEKLLVLSDTRSVYTPLYSGVFWDVQDYLLEDVDRIEVIRGPGATLWGSNAVNGVINITTKSASQTQGLYLQGDAGTLEEGAAAIRYGGSVGDNLHYRVFGSYFERGPTAHGNTVTSDDWRVGRGGFRTDWAASERDTVTVQAEGYRGNIGQLAPSITVIGRPGPQGDLEVRATGGNVLGRWQRRLGESSDLQLRAYYDRTRRNDPSFTDELETVDVDFQHRFQPTGRQEILWGLGYRSMSNRNVGKGLFNLDPASSHDTLVSGFIQDQITVLDNLRLTVGTKLEDNDFSGFEVQPSVRLAWDVRPNHTLWSAVSRAVRVPTRLERDIAVDVTDPALDPFIRLVGNRHFDSEELLAYELGYRWQATRTLAVDLATFHNRYRGLASLEPGTPFVDPADGRTVVPVVNRNLTSGHAQGLESLVTFSPLPFWQLSMSYSWLDLSLDADGLDLNRGEWIEDSTPRHQFGLRSYLDLPAGFQVNALLRSLSGSRRLPEIVTGEGIPGYTELDLQVSWRSSRHVELSLTGLNLLRGKHPEFGAPESRGEIERMVFARVMWRD